MFKKSLPTTATLILVLMWSSLVNAGVKITPQWTERYLFKHHPILLKNSHTDHVLAFYYFGRYKGFTIMGMERVKGDEYEPRNTILVFKDSMLQGYYENLMVFPAGVNSQGEIFFPANRDALVNVDLANNHYPNITFKSNPKIESKYTRFNP